MDFIYVQNSSVNEEKWIKMRKCFPRCREKRFQRKLWEELSVCYVRYGRSKHSPLARCLLHLQETSFYQSRSLASRYPQKIDKNSVPIGSRMVKFIDFCFRPIRVRVCSRQIWFEIVVIVIVWNFLVRIYMRHQTVKWELYKYSVSKLKRSTRFVSLLMSLFTQCCIVEFPWKVTSDALCSAPHGIWRSYLSSILSLRACFIH